MCWRVGPVLGAHFNFTLWGTLFHPACTLFFVGKMPNSFPTRAFHKPKMSNIYIRTPRDRTILRSVNINNTRNQHGENIFSSSSISTSDLDSTHNTMTQQTPQSQLSTDPTTLLLFSPVSLTTWQQVPTRRDNLSVEQIPKEELLKTCTLCSYEPGCGKHSREKRGPNKSATTMVRCAQLSLYHTFSESPKTSLRPMRVARQARSFIEVFLPLKYSTFVGGKACEVKTNYKLPMVPPFAPDEKTKYVQEIQEVHSMYISPCNYFRLPDPSVSCNMLFSLLPMAV